jgi:hypothetical protein
MILIFWLLKPCSTVGGNQRFWDICCYSWEMALNVNIEVSFDITIDGKWMQEKAGDINNMKDCILNSQISRWILNVYCTISRQ